MKSKINFLSIPPRHPSVHVLSWLRAVCISWRVPALHQRILSATSRTAAVSTLQPGLLHQVKTNFVPANSNFTFFSLFLNRNPEFTSLIIFSYAVSTSVSLEVHYVALALLGPSTITLVKTLAQVAHQVCLSSSYSLFSISENRECWFPYICFNCKILL